MRSGRAARETGGGAAGKQEHGPREGTRLLARDTGRAGVALACGGRGLKRRQVRVSARPCPGPVKTGCHRHGQLGGSLQGWPKEQPGMQ